MTNFRSACGRGEVITSFARDSDVDKKTRCLRPQRFYPRRGPSGRWETSVCRATTLKPQQVWDICTKCIETGTSKPFDGRGVGLAYYILKDAGLQMHGDGVPHPDHANILGWHDEPGKGKEDLKHHWMHAAQRIATNFPYLARPG